MYVKFIIAILGVFLIFPMVNANAWCYQERANVSTACGGLSTGSYMIEDETKWNTASMAKWAIDGWWGSWAVANATAGSIGNINVTYSKPLNSLNSSLWQIGFQMGNNTGTNYTMNVSIHNSCWVQSSLKFLMVSERSSADSFWFCYNSTGKVLLYNSTSSIPNGIRLVEEAMVWDTTSCNYTGSGNWIIQSSDYCNITSNTDVNGNNITINGLGTTNIMANITNFNNVWIRGTSALSKAIVYCLNGGCFRK